MNFKITVAGIGEPTFALVHGIASTRRIFDLVIPRLSRQHRVIAYDQRGHGESEKPERAYALSDFVDDLEEILRRHGVSRPVLVGHSFGANVVLRHAVTRRSARGLVLVDGGLVEMHSHLSWDDAVQRLLPPEDDPGLIERWIREGPPFLPNKPELVEMRRSLYEWTPGPRKRLTRERHEHVLRALWEHDVHADLARVPCQTLILPSRRSRQTDPEQRMAVQKRQAAARAARLPNIAVRWFEETLHDVPLHRPVELARTILAFASTLS